MEYVDKKGKIVIIFSYNSANRFQNNKALVKLDDETFYIDKTGKEIK